MKFYYIEKIEQVKATEDSPYTINEFASKTAQKNKDNTPMIYNEVYSKYCEAKKNVSADLIEDDPNNNHYYMSIKIVDSDDNVYEKKKLGTRQEVELKPQPNENTEE